jgi:hypothetical protein
MNINMKKASPKYKSFSIRVLCDFSLLYDFDVS